MHIVNIFSVTVDYFAGSVQKNIVFSGMLIARHSNQIKEIK